MNSGTVDKPRKRGRPRLSPEEKARRAKEREELKKINKVLKPKKQKKIKLKKEIVVEEDEIEFDDDIFTPDIDYESKLRRYTFVIDEETRHGFGSKCAKLPLYVPASYVVNKLMQMYNEGVIDVVIDHEEIKQNWYTLPKYAPDMPNVIELETPPTN